MIYTITPNPALDLAGTVASLVPNEKSYVLNESRFPGGNAINAARIIHKLGLPVIASGFMGGGIGKEVETLLKKEGVHCKFTRIQGNTRISVTVSDSKTHLQTRLSFPGPKILPIEVRNLAQDVRRINPHSLAVIGGSLPPGFTSQQLKKIILEANRRGLSCIVDAPGKILKTLSPCKILLIKPNLAEFEDFVGKKTPSISDIIREARKKNDRIPWICISSVENGALLVTKNRVWFGTIPSVRVKTTVGAGDSMVGAMTAHIWRNKALFLKSSQPAHFNEGENLLRWGLAAATATLITPGTHLGEMKQIKNFYGSVRIKEIL